MGAWRTPGNQSFQAKWADWLRAHHAAAVATAIEQYYDSHTSPPIGDQPARLNGVPAPPTTAERAGRPFSAPAAARVPAETAMLLIRQNPMPAVPGGVMTGRPTEHHGRLTPMALQGLHRGETGAGGHAGRLP